jgi:hypothetical protein
MVTAKLAESVLWCAHPVLQSVLAVVMFRRRLYRSFPVFFAYIVAQIAIFVVLFPLDDGKHYEAFFYTYWLTTAISVLLGFKVIHEIFLDVFRSYHSLRDLGTVLFKWAGLVMLMVACVVAASSTGRSTDPMVNGILALHRSVRVVQVGLVLFLLVFSGYLGTHWKQKSFGFALGLGGYAAIELFMVAFNGSLLSHRAQMLQSLIIMAAYNLAILTWIAYSLAPSTEPTVAVGRIQTRRWEQSLTDLQHPLAADSLIPMFEGMVDRALSGSRGDDHVSAIDEVLVQTDSILSRQTGTGSSHFPAAAQSAVTHR